jgi:hypothetical protein
VREDYATDLLAAVRRGELFGNPGALTANRSWPLAHPYLTAVG